MIIVNGSCVGGSKTSASFVVNKVKGFGYVVM